jgi:hypothetical protein
MNDYNKYKYIYTEKPINYFMLGIVLGILLSTIIF